MALLFVNIHSKNLGKKFRVVWNDRLSERGYGFASSINLYTYDLVGYINRAFKPSGIEVGAEHITIFGATKEKAQLFKSRGFKNVVDLSDMFPELQSATDVWTFDDGAEFEIVREFISYDDETRTSRGYLSLTLSDDSIIATSSETFRYDQGEIVQINFSVGSITYPLRNPATSSSARCFLNLNTVYPEDLTFVNGVTYYYQSYTNNSTAFKKFENELLSNMREYIPSTDPYEPGGVDDGSPSGGGGNFDGESDPVPLPPSMPDFAQQVGLYRIWLPTTEQLINFENWLWSTDWQEQIKKNFISPMESVFSLHALPVTGLLSSTVDLVLGNVQTGLQMNVTGHEYIEIPLGSVNVEEFWGSALDYSPYTKVSIYLPYIGMVPLNIDEIQKSELTVTYRIEVSTGACVAYILVNGNVMYSFNGNCAKRFPISAQSSMSILNTLSGLLTTVGTAVATVATEGMAAPMLVSSAGQTAANVVNAKVDVQHSGTVGDVFGWLGVQTPFLLFERPRQSLPANANVFEGYPANATVKLGDIKGFTRVREIHLEGIPLTTPELNELETLLKEGVIL